MELNWIERSFFCLGHTSGLGSFKQPNMPVHVFRLQERARVPRENQCRHRENTLKQKGPDGIVQGTFLRWQTAHCPIPHNTKYSFSANARVKLLSAPLAVLIKFVQKFKHCLYTVCACVCVWLRVLGQGHKEHLIWARVTEEFKSCFVEEGIFKTVGALFLRQISTQNALLRT